MGEDRIGEEKIAIQYVIVSVGPRVMVIHVHLPGYTLAERLLRSKSFLLESFFQSSFSH